MSDKHLTDNCGLLDHLVPGDTILADRGLLFQHLQKGRSSCLG